MKKFGATTFKIIIAVVIAYLVFNYIGKDKESVDSPLEAALTKLGDILKSGTTDVSTKEKIEEEFSSFKEKAESGEISVAEIEDIAVDILNTRLERQAEKESRINEIINELQKSQTKEQLKDRYLNLGNTSLDSLAIKIDALADFQDRHIEALLKYREADEDLPGPSGIIMIQPDEQPVKEPAAPVVISIVPGSVRVAEPAEPVLRAPEVPVIVQPKMIPLPRIRIKKGLILEIDSTLMRSFDSLKSEQLLRDMEKLKKLEILRQKQLQKKQEALELEQSIEKKKPSG